MNSFDFAQSGFRSETSPPTPPPEQPLLSRRHLIVGGLFVGLTAAGVALAPRPAVDPMPPGTIASWMPDRIGGWTFVDTSGVVLPPPDALSDRLYDNLVTRIYAAPGHDPIMLLVAYSATQDGMLQVHRPEFCYRAGGFGLSPTTDVDISDARGERFGANTFVAAAQDQFERVVYWTRIAGAFPQSWLGQRWAVMNANLEGQIPDGMLARVSSMAAGKPIPIAGLLAFVTALDRAAPPPLHAVLFGSR